MERTFTSERDYWDHYVVEDKNGEGTQAQRLFKRLFPAGHRNTLRTLLKDFAELTALEAKEVIEQEVFEDLDKIHPQGLEFLLRHGKNYTPAVWKRPPKKEPEPASCYLNAWVLMRVQNKKRRRTPIVYVDGVTAGALVNPMLHAWNAVGVKGYQAIDYTLYASSRWSRYLGIPFTQEEYDRIRDSFAIKPKDIVTSFFEKRVFPKTEPVMREILEARKLKNPRR